MNKRKSVNIDSEKIKGLVYNTRHNLTEVSEALGFGRNYLSSCINTGKMPLSSVKKVCDMFGITDESYIIADDNYKSLKQFYENDAVPVEKINATIEDDAVMKSESPSRNYDKKDTLIMDQNDDLINFLKAVNYNITAYLNILEKKGR